MLHQGLELRCFQQLVTHDQLNVIVTGKGGLKSFHSVDRDWLLAGKRYGGWGGGGGWQGRLWVVRRESMEEDEIGEVREE